MIRGAVCLATVIACAAAAAAAAPESDLARRYQATRDRPLFSSTRRPATQAPVLAPPLAMPVATASPAPPPDLAVSGIIVGGGTGTAIVRRATDQAAVRITLGSLVDGWTVTEIRPRAVVLQQNARSVTLELPGPR